METVHEVIGTSLHDGAPAASPRHARASAMLDCGGRRSQRLSVAQLSVDGKSPSEPLAHQRGVVQGAVVADSQSQCSNAQLEPSDFALSRKLIAQARLVLG